MLRVVVGTDVRLMDDYRGARVRCSRISADGTLEIVCVTPFDEHVDQDRPGTFTVIVCHVVVDVGGKV